MSEIETEYQKRLQAWNRLEAEARFIIDQMLIESQVKHHSVIGRIKSIDSVRQKARRKEVANPVEVLEDIVGLRVVCLLRSDIEKIGSAIRKHFLVVAEDNKLDGVSVDAFGYLSVHFVVELSQDCAGPRYRGLHGIRFEIQVRTVAMDAWASLSHYLDYKTEFDVPQVLRKDFFAISGLFYVADTHFELFYKERQRSFVAAKEAVSSASVAIKELNLDTMMAFLQTRFVGRRHDDANGVSELIHEIVDAGYRTIEEIQRVVDLAEASFAAYEAANPPFGAARYADVGVVRNSLAIVDEAYAQRKYPMEKAKFDQLRLGIRSGA